MTDTPKRGQPPKPADERASSFLHIRVLQSDKARWVKEAQSRGLKLAELVRERMG